MTPGHHILFIGHRRDLVQLALTKLTMTCIIDCSDCLFHQAMYISLIDHVLYDRSVIGTEEIKVNKIDMVLFQRHVSQCETHFIYLRNLGLQRHSLIRMMHSCPRFFECVPECKYSTLLMDQER